MSGHPVALPLQLVQEPALGSYRTEGQFRVGIVCQRRAVEDDVGAGRIFRGFLRSKGKDRQSNEKSEK